MRNAGTWMTRVSHPQGGKGNQSQSNGRGPGVCAFYTCHGMQHVGFLKEAKPKYKRGELQPATDKESAGVMSTAPSERRKPGDFIQGTYICSHGVGPHSSTLNLRS